MQANFSPFPQLYTDRLLLRQLTLQDADEIFMLRSDDVVNKYLDRPKATSIEDAKAFINKIISSQAMFWAICFKEEPKLLGTICLWNFSEEDDKAEIGYELLPAFHGKGIMQEAFLKVIEFAFQTLELNSVEAWTTNQNESSKKILERNGFKRNLLLENKIDRAIEGTEIIIYSLPKEVFKQQVAV